MLFVSVNDSAAAVALIKAGQIRAARSLIGAKQLDLAKASGISLATMNNIERGIGDPRASTLGAIEGALNDAGISIAGDSRTETVTLNVLYRPKIYETLLASQKILKILGPNSLNAADQIVFFVRRCGEGAYADVEGLRICLLVRSKDRNLLFDRINFSIENVARAAEIAGVMLAAFALHRDHLSYIENILEDTTTLDDIDALSRLRAEKWISMQHPKDFINLFSNWDDLVIRYVSHPGHPLVDLNELVRKFGPGDSVS